ncbi:MAG: PIN domain-containing protein, partial [Rhodospirillaceae bacterium]|nr:PIN domain-containing protein [Rhodospirillaceae bacterium]
MYLADTNVLSAAAPGRQERSAALVAWMDSHSDSLFLSAVTVAEICDGIAKMRRTGSAARAASLEDWLDLMLHLYAERVLPFDIAAARVAGGLTDCARAAGGLAGFAAVAAAGAGAGRTPVR